MRACCVVARAIRWVTTRRFAGAVLVVLHGVHPIVHGTPLDGGSLDALLAWATVTVMAGDDLA